jgi:hypothetical protein
MSEEFWPGVSIANMSNAEFLELQDAVENDDPGVQAKEIARADLLRFFGMWRPHTGGDLRVGLRKSDHRFSAIAVEPDGATLDGAIDITMERLLIPHLPSSRCTLQLNWAVTHFFERQPKSVGHVTCVSADQGAAAKAVGVPLFKNLKANQGIDLVLGIVAITDPASSSIVSILNSDAFNIGVKLVRHFNPVYGTTVSYIRALTTSVLQKKGLRTQNFKLLEWRTGLAADSRSRLPLVEGTYILLDGRVKIDGKDDDIAWERLSWNPEKERVEYDDEPFVNAHMIFQIRPTSEAEQATHTEPEAEARPARRARRTG